MLKQHANVIPSGLPTLLEGFSRAALKKRPSNLGLFAWYYFTELMKYQTENESFDLRKLVREFHRNMAHRLSGTGFEDELKKEGYSVTSNVNHDYNELYINEEVDLFSWGYRCDGDTNIKGAKPNVPLTAPPNSLVKSSNSAAATEDVKHRVLPEGNQRPKTDKNLRSSELLKMMKGTYASAQPKMQNDVSVKEVNQVDEVKIQVKSGQSHPKVSQSVRKTRLSESPEQALNPGAKGTTATACVHPLKDPPRNHINTISTQQEAKISACSTTMAAQNNSAEAKTDEKAVMEQLSSQLKESSLGTSQSNTDNRKRWALYVNRDGDSPPPSPNSGQSQPQPQLQPETQTGPSGPPWCQQSEAHCCHVPCRPHCGSYGWHPLGPVWFPRPPHLSPYPFWPTLGLFSWGPPCPCFIWPNLERGEPAMPRRYHAGPLGCPLRACAPSQVPCSPCQNGSISSDSTGDNPDPVLLPVDEQSSTGFPRSLYPPVLGCASFHSGSIPPREGEMPFFNLQNRRSSYSPNCHIHPQC